jgi:hypothetical protein
VGRGAGGGAGGGGGGGGGHHKGEKMDEVMMKDERKGRGADAFQAKTDAPKPQPARWADQHTAIMVRGRLSCHQPRLVQPNDSVRHTEIRALIEGRDRRAAIHVLAAYPHVRLFCQRRH